MTARLFAAAPGAILLLLISAVTAPAVHAQTPPPDSLTLVPSLGLPHAFRVYGAVGGGIEAVGPGSRALTRGSLGVARDILNPTPGALGVALEGWVGSRGRLMDGGARLTAGIPAVGLQGGLDYSARDGQLDVVLAVSEPLHRGGFLVPGGLIRVDWIPARTSLLLGLSVPFGQHAGRTRPRAFDVQPAIAPPYQAPPEAKGELAATLAELHERARWVADLTLVPLPPGAPERTRPVAAALAAHLAAIGRTPGATHDGADEAAAYHDLLVRAFAQALASDASARAVADTARRILLDELLIPYDRDLGQIRRPAVLTALARRAGAAFEEWSAASALVPPERHDRAAAVFAALLAIAREAEVRARAAWGDSRLVWLPLQFGLRAEEHDTQSELDGLLERITGRPFLPGHDLDYATDERFEPALRRSIVEAREYHVLWIHDFAGRDPAGRPDTVTERVVLEGYFVALERAALAFDRTGRVPTFLILLDRYYYRRSVSDRWLELLADPLGARFRLRGRWHATEVRVRAAQARLRAAVNASPSLRAAERRYGRRWLRQLLSVHVSVTNPPDPSFRGPAFVGTPRGTLPDDVMRDHRKIAFADLTEEDPARGVAILTGLGVGESYARYRWLDRTIVLRGPAAVTLKDDVRDLLRSQGFRADEIPSALRKGTRAVGAPPASPPEWWARVAVAMNATGYGPKAATAAKAVLYTLLPAGSTIVATDPQWLSRFWGGMLLGSALRGCKVLVIGPGPRNAAFGKSFAQRVLQRELFLRLLDARTTLRAPLAASGGLLEIGLFRIGLGTYNVAGGVRGVRDGLRRHPFVREVLPFDQGVWDLFEQADSLLLALGEAEPDTNASYHPTFHLKTQFMGTAEAMRDAVGRPEWRAFFVQRIRERLHEWPGGTDITLDALAPLRPYLNGRSGAASDRQALYLTVGSQNQDSRSFMLDGEAVCLVAGGAALVSAGDMLLLSTVGVDWLDSPEALDRNFPAYDDIRTEAARALESVF